MEPQASSFSGNSGPERGLPPVAPPSGRFIVQLFLVPGLIVTLAVLVLLGFRYLVGGSHSADYFLRQLDSGNADIRWRGASDLAQVLKRPESVALRSDATFALDLAARLDAALDELERDEKNTGERIKDLPAKQKDAAWAKLTPQRDHVQYLAAALGDFVVPVGAPLLCRIALHDASPDVINNTLQRRKAVWALGNLGESRKGFKQLSAAEQAAILTTLEKEAKGGALMQDRSAPSDDRPASGRLVPAAGGKRRAVWARTALYYLEGKDTPSAGVVTVDDALARCARAEDRFLRVQVALVLGFWYNPRVEPILVELAHDDGHGTLIGVGEGEGNQGR
jgi:hypothetical protein